MRTISVIVPVYYGTGYVPGIIRQIEDCRGCLKDKDYLELLLVNDAPDDPLFYDRQGKDISIKVLNTEINRGIHGARVRGLRECHGEYVLFLDQDDRIKPEYFHSQLQALGRHDAAVCKAMDAGKEYYADGRAFQNIACKEFVLENWNQIISPGQVLLRRDAIPPVWTENIMENNGADDWLLWLCMMAEGRKFSLNKDILYEHVSHGTNASENIVGMARSEHELLRIIQENKIFSGNDLRLLMEGFSLRNLVRAQEMNALKRKMELLDRWMKLRERGVYYGAFLSSLGIKSAAVYGCGMLGRHLVSELNAFVQVKGFIDRNAGEIKSEMPIYTFDEPWPEADCVIVSLLEAEKVEKAIKAKTGKRVLALKDWIMEADKGKTI